MNALLNYMLEANLGLILFMLVYKLVLNNETQFAYRRYYLLASILLSLLFPIFKFQELTPVPSLGQVIPVYWLPETTTGPIAAETTQNTWHLIGTAYLIICGLFLLRLLYRIKILLALTYQNPKATPIEIANSAFTAFSFFNRVFINSSIPLSHEEKDQILKHETIHYKKLHSLDILLIELVHVFFWFNPAISVYKKEIRAVHEFEADQVVAEQQDKEQYCSLLARSAIESSGFQLGNHFNNSLTLKRIAMIKAMKQRVKKWKTFCVFLTVTTLFIAVACKEQVMEQLQEVPTTTRIAGDFPADLLPEVNRIQQQNPGIKMYYVEAESINSDKIKQIAPENILFMAYRKDIDSRGNTISERVGAIVRFGQSLSEETKIAAPDGKDAIFLAVEESATPVGGMNVFFEAVNKNLTVPESVKARGINGRVFIEFIVEPDGTTSGHHLLRGVDAEFDAIALHAVKNTPVRWNPGKQKGKPVRQKLVVPITLR